MERRIVCYIYGLDGASKLFEKTEKDAVKSQFARYHIYQDSLYDKQNFSTEPFKHWKKDNMIFYKKALTQYIKDNDSTFTPFVRQLVKLINDRRSTKALPPLLYNR